ncbi:PIR-like protein [Plasmodium gallinaceum]|uniref:PIR-like protein n=1 Tax=Plasmodium gallinaceum TaxID=5849 RepID=A0A1J1GRZ1_PLAGA|nr:PIR-like protein [Plasmodium gallinaceum]CRG94072.1 PIR-like protein [Plasmodium gallinaceum]
MLNYSIIIFYFSFLINNINLKTEKFFTTWRTLAEEQATAPLIRMARSTSTMEGRLNRWLDFIQEEFFSNIDKFKSNSTGTDAAIQWVKDKTNILMHALNSTNDTQDRNLLSQTLTSWNELARKLLNSTLGLDFSNGSSSSNSTGSSNLPNMSTPLSTLSSFPATDVSTGVEKITTILSENSTGIPGLLSTTSSGIAQESSLGYSISEGCSSIFCGSTTIALSLPFVIIGGLLFFVYLYKFTCFGSFLGRSNIKKERRKRRIYNVSMENIEDPYESSQETESMKSTLESSEETEAKRSKLESSEETETKGSRLENSKKTGAMRSGFNSLARAFGYKYRNIFPYVDSNSYENETAL